MPDDERRHQDEGKPLHRTLNTGVTKAGARFFDQGCGVADAHDLVARGDAEQDDEPNQWSDWKRLSL
jgi:hypothetical protein